MKEVLISIQPYWVFLIIAKAMDWEIKQHKKIEVRKNYPKAEDWNKVAKIYCSKDKKSFERIPEKYRPAMKKFLGKVIGEFVCNRIDRIGSRGINDNFDYCYLSLNEWGNDDIEIEITDIKKSCISKSELNDYGAKSSCLYAWHISNLKIYDKPKELSEFKAYEKIKCPANKNGNCLERTQNQVTLCKNLDCEHKELTRPPQSWCYVEKE